MTRIATFFLLVVTLILAMLLALLGIETLYTNPLGWFLLILGVTCIAGVGISYFIRQERFWKYIFERTAAFEEHNDHSLWLIFLGIAAALFLPPIEYLLLTPVIPRTDWISYSGLALVVIGLGLYVWARQALKENYYGYPSDNAKLSLVQNGPYRYIRNPAYGSFLIMAVGISLGYTSVAGLASIIVLLLPSLMYSMKLEENKLTAHFGDEFKQYMRKTKRLIPGIW